MGDIINMDEPFLAATEEYKWRPCILKIKEKVENLISSVLSIQLVKKTNYNIYKYRKNYLKKRFPC